jgi:nicotinate phosphoribosyltransferase
VPEFSGETRNRRRGTHVWSPLLVDLYELTMAESYVREGLDWHPATFELFARGLPCGWGYLLAAGLEGVLDTLEQLAFDEGDLEYLSSTKLFSPSLLERLARLRFTGDVRALPEGTPCFPGEPLVEVTAPLLEAQLVETAVVNQVHFQTLIASKAARVVEGARGGRLVEFGLRRTHGGDAGLKVARATYLAGFEGTSNVLAGRLYDIPIFGTMAHSYVECFADESAAFEAFVRSYPDGSTLLIDTYDTVAGARRAAAVARTLAARGGRGGGVRLDSGDLLELSREVRQVLDDAGLADVTIFASGGLDELEVDALTRAGAPIDAFGVGTKVGVSADAPYLDMAYKLVAFDGHPKMKLSSTKVTTPGRKQVWRLGDAEGYHGDLVALEHEPGPEGASPLLELVMVEGKRRHVASLADARAKAARNRAALPAACHSLAAEPDPYPTSLTPELRRLRDDTAADLALRHGIARAR